MRTEQQTKCFEQQQQLRARLGHLNKLIPLSFTDRSNAVLLMLFSVLLVLLSFSLLYLPSEVLDDFS